MLFSCIWFKNIWLIYVIRVFGFENVVDGFGHENRHYLMIDN